MNPPSFSVPEVTPQELCARFKPSPEARAILQPDMLPRVYLRALVDADLMSDSVYFLAHWLPKQQAVWWGCLCLWERNRPAPDEATAAALQAALRWVQDPTEENRRAAETASEKAGTDTAAGILALAAFSAEGSLAPPGLPEAPPPPELTCACVAAAVLMAVTQAPQADQARLFRQFLKFGVEVLCAENLWE